MKRAVALLLITAFLTAFAAPAFCDTAVKKLGRGVCNMVTFPWEIVEQVKRTNVSDGPFAAYTYGILKGVLMSCARGLVGVYETGTFFLPLPEDYKPILTDPEFVFEDMNW